MVIQSGARQECVSWAREGVAEDGTVIDVDGRGGAERRAAGESAVLATIAVQGGERA